MIFASAELAAAAVAVADDDIADDIAETEVVDEALTAAVAVAGPLTAAVLLGSVMAFDVAEDGAGVELGATVPLPDVELHPAIINAATAKQANIGGWVKDLLSMLVTIAG